jgi:hypothetical protein
VNLLLIGNAARPTFPRSVFYAASADKTIFRERATDS